MKMHLSTAAGAVACVALATGAATSIASADVQMFQQGYASIADTPFDVNAPQFWMEDFEDGTADQPGVTFSSGFITGPSATTDSVDGDDGAIDGSGTGGWSLTELFDNQVTFFFDSDLLGNLPTLAGIVWTDGAADSNVTSRRSTPTSTRSGSPAP